MGSFAEGLLVLGRNGGGWGQGGFHAGLGSSVAGSGSGLGGGASGPSFFIAPVKKKSNVINSSTLCYICLRN